MEMLSTRLRAAQTPRRGERRGLPEPYLHNTMGGGSLSFVSMI